MERCDVAARFALLDMKRARVSLQGALRVMGRQEEREGDEREAVELR